MLWKAVVFNLLLYSQNSYILALIFNNDLSNLSMCWHRFSLNEGLYALTWQEFHFQFFSWLSLRVASHDESQVMVRFEGKTALNFVTLFAFDNAVALQAFKLVYSTFYILLCKPTVFLILLWYGKKTGNVPVMPGKMLSALQFDFSWSNIVCTRLKQVWTDLKAWEKNSGVKGIQTHECRLGCMYLLKIKQLGAGKSW